MSTKPICVSSVISYWLNPTVVTAPDFARKSCEGGGVWGRGVDIAIFFLKKTSKYTYLSVFQSCIAPLHPVCVVSKFRGLSNVVLMLNKTVPFPF